MSLTLKALLAASLLLAGCVTSYRGPEPDFTKTGSAAREEYENFRLNELFWRQAPHTLLMGREDKRYWARSLEPVMNKVSPDAYSKAMEAEWWSYPAAALFLASAIIFIADANDNGPSRMRTERQLTAFGFLGLSLGTAWIESSKLKKAAQMYNEDLRGKFTPAVSASFSY